MHMGDKSALSLLLEYTGDICMKCSLEAKDRYALTKGRSIPCINSSVIVLYNLQKLPQSWFMLAQYYAPVWRKRQTNYTSWYKKGEGSYSLQTTEWVLFDLSTTVLDKVFQWAQQTYHEGGEPTQWQCAQLVFLKVMTTHNVGVKAVFVLALLATHVTHKRVSMTMATNVNGEQDLIVKCDAAVWASRVGTGHTLLLTICGEGSGCETSWRWGEDLALNAALYQHMSCVSSLCTVLRSSHSHCGHWFRLHCGWAWALHCHTGGLWLDIVQEVVPQTVPTPNTPPPLLLLTIFCWSCSSVKVRTGRLRGLWHPWDICRGSNLITLLQGHSARDYGVKQRSLVPCVGCCGFCRSDALRPVLFWSSSFTIKQTRHARWGHIRHTVTVNRLPLYFHSLPLRDAHRTAVPAGRSCGLPGEHVSRPRVWTSKWAEVVQVWAVWVGRPSRILTGCNGGWCRHTGMAKEVLQSQVSSVRWKWSARCHAFTVVTETGHTSWWSKCPICTPWHDCWRISWVKGHWSSRLHQPVWTKRARTAKVKVVAPLCTITCAHAADIGIGKRWSSQEHGCCPSRHTKVLVVLKAVVFSHPAWGHGGKLALVTV